MKRPISWFGAGMGTLLLLAPNAYAKEEKVPPENVPKPVMDAVKARFNDAEVTGAAKEKGDGKLVYEVSLNLKGKNIDMLLAPDGEIRMIEKTIARQDLPNAVVKALEDKYPEATYKRLEEVIEVKEKKETLVYYEALLVTAGTKELEVKLTTEGKIMKE